MKANGNATVVHVHFEGKPTGKIRWLAAMPDMVAFRQDLDELGAFLNRLLES